MEIWEKKPMELTEIESITTTPANSDGAQRVERLITCECCAAPARVHVLEGYTRGKPIRRHYCLNCADQSPQTGPPLSFEHFRSRLSIGSLLLFTGVALVVLGISVDQLGYHGSSGFGWRQMISLALGVFCVAIGALLHADLLAIAGSIVFGAAAAADLFGTMGSPGFGWRQTSVVLLGFMLIMTGLYRRRRRLKREISKPGMAS